jgi:hypothetical protein
VKKLDYNTENLEALSNSELKKVADYWMRQYLLNTTAGMEDRIWCPIKKRSYHKDQMQVAHYIDRSILSLRFDLYNCHLISKESNEYDSKVVVEGYKSKHHKEYEEYLKLKYGEGILDYFKVKSEIKEPFTKEQYIKIIKTFKNG